MKKALFLIFLVSLISVSALTEEAVLFPGQSFTFSDKNITLIAIGEEVIVVCVNNERGIVDEFEIFNGVEFELDRIEDDFVEMTLKTDCSDCVCDESCDNNLCYVEDVEPLEENETIEECENCTEVVTLPDVVGEEEGVIVGEEKKTNYLVYLSVTLFLLLVLVVLIFLLKKKR